MKCNLANLASLENFKSILDSLHEASGINTSIVDLNCNILTFSGHLDLCRNFYKYNSNKLFYCQENNKYVIEYLKKGNSYTYKSCGNNLTNIAVPIKIDDELIAILYCGQFLLEQPNIKFFEEKANTCGFNQTEYINAVKSIPVLTKEKVYSITELLINISKVIGKIAANELQKIEWDNKLASNYQELEATYEELLATEEELRNQYEKLQDSQEKLRKSEEKYKLALQGSHDGIWDWDIKNNTYHYSEKWETMLGYSKNTVSINNTAWSTFIHPEDIAAFNEELNNYLSKVSEKYKCEYRIKRNDGVYIWISDMGAATWDKNGEPIRMVGSHTDITEQKKWSQEINKMAFFDSLTGLPNKFSLYRDLSELCKDTKSFSTIYLDVDNFKLVNDIHGPSFGDKILNKLCFVLSSTLDDNSTLYKWGGDEFIFVRRNVTSESDATSFMEEVVKKLNTPIIFEGLELYVTASIGASIYPKDSLNIDDLIKNSHIAMYKAKSLGKNNFQLYHPSLSESALEEVTLERELRKALKNKEFQVYYQPRIDIKTSKLVGMEALVRWVKADGTIISPLKFIPKAEETGLIIPIGEIIIETVCKQIRLWKDKGYDNLIASINLSPKQIEDKSLINIIRKNMSLYSVNPSNIEIEITESVAIKDMNQTLTFISELKNMGINVLLDDFGTGYSSLNFLRLLPVTTIKIDKSFIDKVEDESMEKTIVESIISLAHNIQLKVIAEGIEKPSQLDFLQDNYCDEAQGYYFSKPLNPDDFEKLLKDRKKILDYNTN